MKVRAPPGPAGVRLGRRAAGLPGRLRGDWREPDVRGAAGDVVYSCGVLIGVVQWSLGLRKTR